MFGWRFPICYRKTKILSADLGLTLCIFIQEENILIVFGESVGIRTSARRADTTDLIIVVITSCGQDGVLILVAAIAGHDLNTILGACCSLNLGIIGMTQCLNDTLADYCLTLRTTHDFNTGSRAGCGIGEGRLSGMLAAGSTGVAGLTGLSGVTGLTGIAGSSVVGISSIADAALAVDIAMRSHGNLNALQYLLTYGTDLTGQTLSGAGCGSRLNLSLVGSQRQLFHELIATCCAVEVFTASDGAGGVGMLNVCVLMLAQRIAGTTNSALLAFVLMSSFNDSLILLFTANRALAECSIAICSTGSIQTSLFSPGMLQNCFFFLSYQNGITGGALLTLSQAGGSAGSRNSGYNFFSVASSGQLGNDLMVAGLALTTLIAILSTGSIILHQNLIIVAQSRYPIGISVGAAFTLADISAPTLFGTSGFRGSKVELNDVAQSRSFGPRSLNTFGSAEFAPFAIGTASFLTSSRTTCPGNILVIHSGNVQPGPSLAATRAAELTVTLLLAGGFLIHLDQGVHVNGNVMAQSLDFLSSDQTAVDTGERLHTVSGASSFCGYNTFTVLVLQSRYNLLLFHRIMAELATSTSSQSGNTALRCYCRNNFRLTCYLGSSLDCFNTTARASQNLQTFIITCGCLGIALIHRIIMTQSLDFITAFQSCIAYRAHLSCRNASLLTGCRNLCNIHNSMGLYRDRFIYRCQAAIGTPNLLGAGFGAACFYQNFRSHIVRQLVKSFHLGFCIAASACGVLKTVFITAGLSGNGYFTILKVVAQGFGCHTVFQNIITTFTLLASSPAGFGAGSFLTGYHNSLMCIRIDRDHFGLCIRTILTGNYFFASFGAGGFLGNLGFGLMAQCCSKSLRLIHITAGRALITGRNRTGIAGCCLFFSSLLQSALMITDKRAATLRTLMILIELMTSSRNYHVFGCLATLVAAFDGLDTIFQAGYIFGHFAIFAKYVLRHGNLALALQGLITDTALLTVSSAFFVTSCRITSDSFLLSSRMLALDFAFGTCAILPSMILGGNNRRANHLICVTNAYHGHMALGAIKVCLGVTDIHTGCFFFSTRDQRTCVVTISCKNSHRQHTDYQDQRQKQM